MKIDSIQRYRVTQTDNYASAKQQNSCARLNSPSFGGALAINFWDAIQRGGFAAAFTVQDMTGTNFPRTWQALHRNKDITGENNYKAASEVMIREFLTGPSMCIIPCLVLAASKKLSGCANEVPLENIGVFSDQMKTILKSQKIMRTDFESPNIEPDKYVQKVKMDFYKRMFALALGENPDNEKEISRSASDLASMLLEYDSAKNRGFIRQLLNKDIIEKANNGATVPSKDQILNKMVKKFTHVKKQRTDNYDELLTSDMNGLLSKQNKISSLIKDISNFGNDIQKQLKTHVTPNGALTSVPFEYNSFMDEFKIQRTGSKFITNVLMVLLTGLFMLNIPKIYSSLHKTNPETDAFRDKEGEVIRANK